MLGFAIYNTICAVMDISICGLGVRLLSERLEVRALPGAHFFIFSPLITFLQAPSGDSMIELVPGGTKIPVSPDRVKEYVK